MEKAAAHLKRRLLSGVLLSINGFSTIKANLFSSKEIFFLKVVLRYWINLPSSPFYPISGNSKTSKSLILSIPNARFILADLAFSIINNQKYSSVKK